MDIFLGQIKKIMIEEGLTKGVEFDRAAGIKNKVARWFNVKYRANSVEIDTLLSIAKRFDKSLDWLVFGQELAPKDRVAETASTYDARQPAPVDIELIAEVVDKVEDWLNRARLQISTRRTGVLVSMVFEHCVVEKVHPDDDIIKPYYILSRRVP